MAEEDGLAAFTAYVSYQRFTETMKHDSAKDLVRQLNRFVHEFDNRKPDATKDSERIQAFYLKMESDFRKHRLWRNASAEELNLALEGMEKYVTTKLHNRIFARYSEDRERDQFLSARLAALQFVQPSHLDIPENIITNGSLLLAVKELQKVNGCKCPRDKLVCMLNCCRVILNLLKTAGKASGGADIFVPVLDYVVIKAQPDRFISNLEYIRRFRMKSQVTSYAEYYFMQLNGSSCFIETADASSFTNGRQEFLSSFLQHGLMSWQQYEEAMNEDGIDPDAKKNRPTTPVRSPKHVGDKANSPLNASVSVADGGASTSGASAFEPSRSQPTQVQTQINWEGVASLSDLEAEGSERLAEFVESGRLVAKYPFMSMNVGDLTLGRVEELLAEHKSMALTYEVLKETAMYKDSAAVSRLIMENDEGQRWKSVWPSTGQLLPKYPFLCTLAADMTIKSITQLLAEYKELVFTYETLELALKARFHTPGAIPVAQKVPVNLPEPSASLTVNQGSMAESDNQATTSAKREVSSHEGDISFEGLSVVGSKLDDDVTACDDPGEHSEPDLLGDVANETQSQPLTDNQPSTSFQNQAIGSNTDFLTGDLLSGDPLPSPAKDIPNFNADAVNDGIDVGKKAVGSFGDDFEEIVKAGDVTDVGIGNVNEQDNDHDNQNCSMGLEVTVGDSEPASIAEELSFADDGVPEVVVEKEQEKRNEGAAVLEAGEVVKSQSVAGSAQQEAGLVMNG